MDDRLGDDSSGPATPRQGGLLKRKKALFKELGVAGSAAHSADEFGVSSEEATQDVILALREYSMHLPMPGAPEGFRATREKVEGCPICYPRVLPRVPRDMAWTAEELSEWLVPILGQ